MSVYEDNAGHKRYSPHSGSNRLNARGADIFVIVE